MCSFRTPLCFQNTVAVFWKVQSSHFVTPCRLSYQRWVNCNIFLHAYFFCPSMTFHDESCWIGRFYIKVANLPYSFPFPNQYWSSACTGCENDEFTESAVLRLQLSSSSLLRPHLWGWSAVCILWVFRYDSHMQELSRSALLTEPACVLWGAAACDRLQASSCRRTIHH